VKKERLLPKVEKEKETKAIEEIKKGEQKCEGENENHNKNDVKVEQQEENLEAPLAKPISSPPEEVVLKVFMHCKGCAKKVRNSLKDLEGIYNSPLCPGEVKKELVHY
jgi:Heavy-metal-associated domain